MSEMTQTTQMLFCDGVTYDAQALQSWVNDRPVKTLYKVGMGNPNTGEFRSMAIKRKADGTLYIYADGLSYTVEEALGRLLWYQ